MAKVKSKRLTSALVVQSPEGWLLAHRTATSHWDLPKGGVDAHEHPRDAALRECWEETGLDLGAYREQLVDTGRQSYRYEKDLQIFFLALPTALDLSQCHCRTLVTKRTGHPIPDMDAFAWVPLDEVPQLLHPRLVTHVRHHGWLPASPTDAFWQGWVDHLTAWWRAHHPDS